MLPRFRGNRMRANEPIMRDASAASRGVAGGPRVRRAPEHAVDHARRDLQAVFGVSDEARRARLHQLLADLLAATTSMSLQVQVLFGRMAPLEALQRQAGEIDALLLEEIAARRTSPGADICSLLVQARFEDGTGMSDGEIRDQLMTLLMAGHETTATGLAWTLDLFGAPPRRARARADRRRDLPEGGRERVAAPAPGGAPGRAPAAVPLEVDGLSLPVGTDVTPAMWLTHTRPEEYPEPYAFRPERFLESPPSTYTWIPFGGGVRRCIGAPFAELEMRVVLGEVLERFDLRPAGRGAEGVARRNVTFSPRHGTRIVATPR